MYLFDFKKTVAQLRELVQTSACDHGAWTANARVESEFAAQAIEFLFDHLIQFEQFTAAAHLVAWCIPASIRGSKRMTKLVNLALTYASKMASHDLELDLVRGAKAQELPTSYLVTPQCIPPRAKFWLHCALLRKAQSPMEYGTGGGANVLHSSIMAQDLNWTGIDLISSQIEYNRAKAKEIGRNNAFFFLPEECQERKFDVIGVLDVLEHTAYPLEVLAKAESFLAPGGLMVLAVPNGPWSLISDNNAKENLACNHVNVSSATGMIQMVQERGRILTMDLLPGPNWNHANSSVCIAYELNK